MREIKFRCWIKENKKMIFSPGVDTNDLADKTMPHFWSICEDYTCYKDDVVLMQFTGLKDKSGVEIYEGDIVKYLDDPQEDPEYRYGKFEVEWDGDGFYITNVYGHDLEVIGNIYENPELLKESK